MLIFNTRNSRLEI